MVESSMLILFIFNNTFKIKVIDKFVERILDVQFTHKDIGSTFIVYGCYLHRIWVLSLSYMGVIFIVCGCYLHRICMLITQMYLNSETEQIYICGDFNSRIAQLIDTIDYVDFDQKEMYWIK